MGNENSKTNWETEQLEVILWVDSKEEQQKKEIM